MEFNVHRGSQPAAGRPAPGTVTPANSDKASGKSGDPSKNNPKWLRIVSVITIFAAACILVGVAIMFYSGGTQEDNYIDSKKGQAVFLTNGQVYFGKIKHINKQYIDLTNIYYLNVSQQVQPTQTDKNATTNSVSLVKLGCELHGPLDQMIINRDQVTFWENLRNDGQVAKAIEQWVKENPNGQQCSTSTTTTSSTTTTGNKQ